MQTPTGQLPVEDAPECRGRVRWFSREKGYGFIVPDDGGDDVFVRHSAIVGSGFRTLEAGQRVRFLRTSDDRGPRAAAVRVV